MASEQATRASAGREAEERSEKAYENLERAKESANTSKYAASDSASSAWEGIQEGTLSVLKSVQGKYEHAKDIASKKSESSVKKACEAKTCATDKAGECKDAVVDSATNKAGECKDAVVDKAKQAKDSTVGKARETRDSAMDEGQGKSQEAEESFKDKAEQARNTIYEAVTGLKDAIQETLRSVTSANRRRDQHLPDENRTEICECDTAERKAVNSSCCHDTTERPTKGF